MISGPPTNSNKSKRERIRPKSQSVPSQPADTGTGSNINTQLVYAVNHLKDNGNPMQIEDLAILTKLPLMHDRTLFDRFKSHDRVIFDKGTGLFSYRHDFKLQHKTSLLRKIKRHGGGLSVRKLQESWSGASAAIDELVKEGELLVVSRHANDPEKMVYRNEVPAPKPPVDEEFRVLWHSLEVPPDADILRQLEDDGLQATTDTSQSTRA